MRCGLTQPVGFDTAVKNYNSPYQSIGFEFQMPSIGHDGDDRCSGKR